MPSTMMPERNSIRIEAEVVATLAPAATAPGPAAAPALVADRFSFFYGATQALHGISMEIPKNRVTALIGPSGCGKSTFLRSINRMNDLIPNTRHEGDIRLHGDSVYRRDEDVVLLRRRIGMVFQKSNPFPKSIYDNVAYGARVNGLAKRRSDLDEIVERSLRSAALWDEVSDRLDRTALGLSGGQQQRLCIARALAVSPEVLLMDEPASALDPIATQKIEELIYQLKDEYTIVIVTHNMQQAARVSDRHGLLLHGEADRGGEYGPHLHQSDRGADRGVHHREVRMTPQSGVRHFHEDLAQLKSRLLDMSSHAEELLGLAMEALRERDVEKAEAVIRGDREIDALEIEVDEACIQLLALQQPIARDLRLITMAMKISNDLERVGDHAVNIAQAVKHLVDAPPIGSFPEIEEMARQASEMLSDALDHFVRSDSRGAREVCARDDRVDALHESHVPHPRSRT